MNELPVPSASVLVNAALPPMGVCLAKEVSRLPCANGVISKGARVQTQYTRAEGGDDLWYTASTVACYDNGQVQLVYDDDDRWRGLAVYVYLLPPNALGWTQRQPYGAPGQGAQVLPPSSENVVMATPIAMGTPTVIGAAV